MTEQEELCPRCETKMEPVNTGEGMDIKVGISGLPDMSKYKYYECPNCGLLCPIRR